MATNLMKSIYRLVAQLVYSGAQFNLACQQIDGLVWEVNYESHLLRDLSAKQWEVASIAILEYFDFVTQQEV